MDELRAENTRLRALLAEFAVGDRAGYVDHEGFAPDCQYCTTIALWEVSRFVYPHTADCIVTRARHVLASHNADTAPLIPGTDAL